MARIKRNLDSVRSIIALEEDSMIKSISLDVP